ncbi:hypothetical protein NIES4071_04320 [Calothrix sp. NIES-4071]|nr:hypothetical protein NIES4071_04320 [Calothrix sp. NIES-4071]BAZ54778.1 hypothetical protein NIES4105_04310 [Calothrix sp. NIES-4105]
MTEPLFWLGLSLLLVAASLAAVLVAAIPALQELARAARSAEKLFDTLSRELPPTLDAIRTTGLEITDLTDDVSEGVKSASQVVKQVDQSLEGARKQAQSVQIGTRSLFAGMKTAWKTLTRPKQNRRNSGQPLRGWEYQQKSQQNKDDIYSSDDIYEESIGWVNSYDNKKINNDIHPKSIKPNDTED